VIARILIAVSVALLIAAAAPSASGGAPPAPSAQIELVDVGAPLADDEAVTPCVLPPAASRACAAPRAPAGQLPPPQPMLARVFRPPRTPLA